MAVELDGGVKVYKLSKRLVQVLAVDISIWLNQAVRGMRDKSGHAVPHAHLVCSIHFLRLSPSSILTQVGLYHRVCKLLFYKIKPVFVFDGKPPQLKRDTLNRRRLVRNQQGKKAAQASQAILQVTCPTRKPRSRTSFCRITSSEQQWLNS